MVELEDPWPLKVSKTRIAELSQPDRAQNEYIRQKQKENEKSDPRCRESGCWEMSSSEI
jgi:hypothetical protein